MIITTGDLSKVTACADQKNPKKPKLNDENDDNSSPSLQYGNETTQLLFEDKYFKPLFLFSEYKQNDSRRDYLNCAIALPSSVGEDVQSESE